MEILSGRVLSSFLWFICSDSSLVYLVLSYSSKRNSIREVWGDVLSLTSLHVGFLLYILHVEEEDTNPGLLKEQRRKHDTKTAVNFKCK